MGLGVSSHCPRHHPRSALPAEWHQWLHKARAEPPTPDDIQRGIHQRELYRQRVAEIEAAEAAAKFQQQTRGRAGGGGFQQQLPGPGAE